VLGGFPTDKDSSLPTCIAATESASLYMRMKSGPRLWNSNQ
jgi:hypothetical protein